MKKSWGNYPIIENTVSSFHTSIFDESDGNIIPFGNGRSYGDSCLNEKIVTVKEHNYFLHFDEKKGLLHVQAGVLLKEILEVFVPRGWFLSVSPGTKLVTVGGCIASDVHGKNHHKAGCFSECVEEFNLLLPNGELKTCSKTQNVALFRATCGGMGLTGIITDAKIFLKPIQSKYIQQSIIKTKNLKDTLEVFESEELQNAPYSVAWIDCLSKGKKQGRSLINFGDFCEDQQLDYHAKTKLNIPFYFPSFALNKWSVKAFNFLYYNRIRKRKTVKKVKFESFFYPLDAITNWNRIYGKDGFTQYQFILPKANSYKGLQLILSEISKAQKGSFLVVLKLYGKENENYLSFPIEGYSLALDFKIEKGIFELLDRLDALVNEFEGRVYLSKDVRITKENFEKGYPKIEQFRAIRKEYEMAEKLQSLQSRRVEI